MALSSPCSHSSWDFLQLRRSLESIDGQGSLEGTVTGSYASSATFRVSLPNTIATSFGDSDIFEIDMDSYTRRENWGGGDREEFGRRSPREFACRPDW